MSVTATLDIALRGTLRGTNDLGSPAMPFELIDKTTFNPGTGNSQANLVFADTRTIAASSNDDLDLAGVLAGVFGGTLGFAVVRAIIIRAAAGNTNNVVIGAAASNQFVGPFGAATHTVTLRPGDEFVVTNRNAGWAVTAGTGDLLRIANSGSGTPVNYDIVIIGS
jgi:hypothetical protein